MEYPSAHLWCYLINVGFHFLSLWPSTRDMWFVLTSALWAGNSTFWVVLPGWCNQGPAFAPVIFKFLWCGNFGSHLLEMVWPQVVEEWLQLGETWTTCLGLGISGKQNCAKSLRFLGLFVPAGYLDLFCYYEWLPFSITDCKVTCTLHQIPFSHNWLDEFSNKANQELNQLLSFWPSSNSR